MRNLLLFFLRYQNFFLFFLLEVICLILIFNYQYYHRFQAFRVAQEVTGSYYSMTSGVRQYFNLQQVNDSLRKANKRLMNRSLMREREASQTDSLTLSDSTNMLPRKKMDTIRTDTGLVAQSKKYKYAPAKVIFNSVNKRNNYLTLNKGAKDGLEAPMGLTTSKGVVGILKNVSSNYAVGISVLHNDFSISCEIPEINQIGALNWNGENPQILQFQDIPTHVTIRKGQKVVTSPYSRLFPPDLPVGRIVAFSKGPGANFYDIQVKLNENLRSLQHVYAIENQFLEEQVRLENAAKQ